MNSVIFYCHKCGCFFELVRTIKDSNGNPIGVYKCPRCNSIKYA